MALKFAYNRNVAVQAKLICRSKLSMIKYVFEQLDDCHKQHFESSCFKNLLNLRSTNVGYQLFHQLLMRQVQTKRTKEIWFKFKGKISRFGLEEFTLITGLNAGDLEEEVVKGKNVPRLLKSYFSNKWPRKINREDLLKAFGKCNNPEDKYKLGLLVCLVSVLLGAEQRTRLNPWFFFIVEDADKFNNYPWGKKSFLYTIKNFKRKLEIASNKSPQKKDVRYNLHGFPLAVMIWGLEAIPALGKRFANSIGERVPRMLSWKFKDRLLSTTLNTFLESRERNVIRKMEPTEAEKAETFWQQLTHFDDKEDSKVDNIEDDDDESVCGGAEEVKIYELENIPPEVCAGRQLDGNQTLLENHIGMESTCAGIIKNREGPQSAPAQLNSTSQGQCELRKRPKPQIAPEQNKRARLATETTPNSNSHSISDTSDGELFDKTYKSKLDSLALYQEKTTAALSDLMVEFRARPPSMLTQLEDLKRETASARSKEKELEAIISELRHKNTELSSRCAFLVAEDKKIKEKLTVSRTKEKELESIISNLRHEKTELSSRCASLVAEDEQTKEELMVSRSKEKELEFIICRLRHENTELSSRCASLVAEDKKTKEELTVSRTKEIELKASNSKLTQENKKFSAQCAGFEAEYKRTIHELMVASSKEKELKATISELTHKNKVFSVECSSYESQIVALEVEYMKTKEELSNAERKFYSGARAAGYAEGLKDGKSKWLKSAKYLIHLTDASKQYFDYGFDSCQKQAEQQGFVGKLDKNSALNDALLKAPQILE